MKALGPVAVCRREWSAIKCEVRDDFKGKGRGEGGERGFVVDVVEELRNSVRPARVGQYGEKEQETCVWGKRWLDARDVYRPRKCVVWDRS